MRHKRFPWKFQEGEAKRMMGWTIETLVSNKQYILCIYIYFNIQSQSTYPLMEFSLKQTQPVTTVEGVLFTSNVFFIECALRWVMAISIGCGAPAAFLLLSSCSMAFDAMHLLRRATLWGIWGLEIGRDFFWSLETLLAWAKVESPLCK